MADEEKKELKRKKKEAKEQIKNIKKKQKEQRKEISRIKEENGVSHASSLLTIILVVLFIMILLVLIKMDVGGFGSKVLAPIIGDIPYVNRILPEGSARDEIDITGSQKKKKKKKATTEETTTEVTTEMVTTRKASSTTQKETQQEEEQSAQTADSGNASGQNSNADQKNSSDSVSNPNLDPTMQAYVDTYTNMDPASAAAILEGMAGDYHLVAEILYNMDATSRANILAAMSTNNAAKIMKIIERM